jgi:hypothetical protein
MTPDMKVTRVDLFNARSLSGIKQELEQQWKNAVNFPIEEAQDWTGFGPVKRLDK